MVGSFEEIKSLIRGFQSRGVHPYDAQILQQKVLQGGFTRSEAAMLLNLLEAITEQDNHPDLTTAKNLLASHANFYLLQSPKAEPEQNEVVTPQKTMPSFANAQQLATLFPRGGYLQCQGECFLLGSGQNTLYLPRVAGSSRWSELKCTVRQSHNVDNGKIFELQIYCLNSVLPGVKETLKNLNAQGD